MEIEKDFEELVSDAQNAVDDIQKDTRPKRRMIQVWWAKFNEQLDKRRNLILFAIILSIVGLYVNPTIKDIPPVTKAVEVKEIPKVKVKAGVFYTINLDNMYTDKSKATSDGFVVYYRDKEKNATMWFTLEEPIDKLKYNKIHYPKYLEQQALLEAKEAK